MENKEFNEELPIKISSVLLDELLNKVPDNVVNNMPDRIKKIYNGNDDIKIIKVPNKIYEDWPIEIQLSYSDNIKEYIEEAKTLNVEFENYTIDNKYDKLDLSYFGAIKSLNTENCECAKNTTRHVLFSDKDKIYLEIIKNVDKNTKNIFCYLNKIYNADLTLKNLMMFYMKGIFYCSCELCCNNASLEIRDNLQMNNIIRILSAIKEFTKSQLDDKIKAIKILKMYPRYHSMASIFQMMYDRHVSLYDSFKKYVKINTKIWEMD